MLITLIIAVNLLVAPFNYGDTFSIPTCVFKMRVTLENSINPYMTQGMERSNDLKGLLSEQVASSLLRVEKM